MALWNPDDLIPNPVFGVIGVVGLTALGLAAVVGVVASFVAWRRRDGDADNPTSAHLPMAWWIAKQLAVLGTMLLLVWSLPYEQSYSIKTGQVPMGYAAW